MEAVEKYLNEFKSLVSDIPFSVDVLENRLPTYNDILNYLLSLIKPELTSALKILVFCLALIVISSVASEISEDLSAPIGFAAVLCILSFLMKNGYINELVKDESMIVVEKFINSFVPIFAIVTALSGKITLSTLYGGLSIFSIELFSLINNQIVIPVILISALLGLLLEIGTDFSTEISSRLRKLVVLCQTVLTTIILGIMGLNSFASTGSDTLLSKASRAVMGSAIPGIGSTLSSGYETLSACFLAAKNLIGVSGVFAVLVLSLPFFLKCLSLFLVFEISELFSMILNNSGLSKAFNILKNSSVLLVSTAFFEMIILVLGIATVMLVSG